jgi:hypothetical protein
MLHVCELGTRLTRFSNQLNQRGSAAVAVLGTIAFMGAAIEMSTKIATTTSTAIGASRISASRDALVYQVGRYAALPSSFRSSIDPTLPLGVNQSLKNCILGTVPGRCKGDGMTEQAFSLYSPLVGGNAFVLAGPGPSTQANASPTYYDQNGNRCATKSNCPFQVYATFVAKCPALEPAPCDQAESVKVHFEIKFAPKAGTPSVIATPMLAPISMVSASTDVSSILSSHNGATDTTITRVTLLGGGATTTVVADSPLVDSIYNAIAGIGIADRGIARALVRGGITQTGDAVYLVDHAVKNNHMVDTAIIEKIASVWVDNPHIGLGIAQRTEPGDTIAAIDGIVSAIKQSGITSNPLIEFIAYVGWTDVGKIGALNTTLLPYASNEEIFGGIMYNAQDNNQTPMTPAQAKATLDTIKAAGVTDGPKTWMLTVAGVTSVAQVNAILGAGIVREDIAFGAVKAGVTTAAQALTYSNWYKGMSADSGYYGQGPQLTIAATSEPAASGGTQTTTVTTTTTPITPSNPIAATLVQVCNKAQCNTSYGF